jgi:hypothetical protein
VVAHQREEWLRAVSTSGKRRVCQWQQRCQGRTGQRAIVEDRIIGLGDKVEGGFKNSLFLMPDEYCLWIDNMLLKFLF